MTWLAGGAAILAAWLGAAAPAMTAPVTPAVTGVVVDSTRLPLPGATVTRIDSDGRAAGTAVVTDAQGRFALEDAAAPVTIEVAMPGFATARVLAAEPSITVVLHLAAEGTSVVVEGSAVRDALTGATALTRDDLDRVPAVTTDERLEVVSGFSLFRRSSSRASNPTTHGVSMRGLSASGASRALVVFDGVPLNDGFGGWITWERVPGTAIESVSVERGPMGDLAGSDALGGLIRLAPVTPRRTSAEVAAQFGSLGTHEETASGGGVRGRSRVFGAASAFHTDGFIALEESARGAVDTPLETTWSNVYGRGLFGARQRLTLAGWYGTADRNNGTALQVNSNEGATGLAAYERAGSALQFGARASIGTNNYVQTFSAVASGRASERLTSTQHIDTSTLRASAELSRRFTRGLVLGRVSTARTSATFSDERATGTTERLLDDDSTALAIQGAVEPASRVSLTAGGRVEWRAAGDRAAELENRTAAIGRLAAAVRLNNLLTARGAAATSHRWPSLNEMVRDFSAGSTTTRANPDLEPERARSIEAGLTAARGAWSVSATAFRAVVLDAVSNVTLSSGSTIVRERRNAGEAHSHGLELDAEAAMSHVRLRGSFTALDAKFRHSLEAPLEGNWLPQIPATAFALSGDVLLPARHVLSVVFARSSSQFDDDRNVFRLAPSARLDARLAGVVDAGTLEVGWHLSAENLTDARIETGRTPLVALAQGRAFRAGLSIRY